MIKFPPLCIRGKPHVTPYLQYNWYQCRVAAVKRLPVLHYSVVYIFGSFVIAELIPDFLKIYMSVSTEA